MQWLDDEITNGAQTLRDQYEVSGLQATSLGYLFTFDVMTIDLQCLL